ncbi:grifin [Sarcophilus harrisii]|uniref:grifin n=1 Tax=Sarcophilus harrisii TaxID=9305 RepID=UPI0013020945|nr:grifin [Sarcophilus harrisii]
MKRRIPVSIPEFPSLSFHSQFEAFCSGGLVPGWSLIVQGQSNSKDDEFEINFLCESGNIAFHFKPRFSNGTLVCNSFQHNHWGEEEIYNVFPLELKEPFEVKTRLFPSQIEVFSDSEHFHVFIQENKVAQYEHRQKPLSSITKVQVLNDLRFPLVELSKKRLYLG